MSKVTNPLWRQPLAWAVLLKNAGLGYCRHCRVPVKSERKLPGALWWLCKTLGGGGNSQSTKCTYKDFTSNLGFYLLNVSHHLETVSDLRVSRWCLIQATKFSEYVWVFSWLQAAESTPKSK